MKKKKDTKLLTYTEQLAHPLWQKKRLEVLESAKWQCEDCGSKDDTLSVHHCYYEYGKLLWEYGLDTMMALCWPCHENRQTLERDGKLAIARAFRKSLNLDEGCGAPLRKLVTSIVHSLDGEFCSIIAVDEQEHEAHVHFVDAFARWSGVDRSKFDCVGYYYHSDQIDQLVREKISRE